MQIGARLHLPDRITSRAEPLDPDARRGITFGRLRRRDGAHDIVPDRGREAVMGAILGKRAAAQITFEDLVLAQQHRMAALVEIDRQDIVAHHDMKWSRALQAAFDGGRIADLDIGMVAMGIEPDPTPEESD
jgi:hypothetical protein